MFNLSSLNPYMAYIKIAGVALVVALLISAGIWIRGVFAERAALRVSEKAAIERATTANETAKLYADAYNERQELQKGIQDAVKNVRTQSTDRIRVIESGPAPVAGDGDVVVLVRPGQADSMSTAAFANVSTGRNTASTAGSHVDKTR